MKRKQIENVIIFANVLIKTYYDKSYTGLKFNT